MSNVQIPNLPSATSLSGSEELEIVQGGVSRRTTTQAIADLNPPQGTVTQINTTGGISGGPITTTGTIQIQSGGVTNAKLADVPAQTVKGNSGGTSGPPSDLSMATLSTMLSLAPSATTDTTNASNITSGTLAQQRYWNTLSSAINLMVNPVTPDIGSLLYYGASGWTAINAGANGQVLQAKGSGQPPEWFTTTGTGTVTQVSTGTGLSGGPITISGTISIANTGVTAASYGATNKAITLVVNAQGQITSAVDANIAIAASQVTSGTLSAARGGTGNNSYVIGDLLYASAATTLSKLSAGTLDYVLTSNGSGAAPSYKQVSLTAGVTGILPVANGGTGANTLTGYVKGSGTSAFTASATIPNTDITGLGTMSTQNASSVNISGGTATLTSVYVTNGTVSNAPVNPTDLANKSYVDSVAQGLDIKASCRVASTGNLALSGLVAVDGVTVVAGNRVLVKNQTAPAQNGIYIAASGAWSRSPDADTWDELVSAFVFIESGSTQADTAWVCTVDAGGTLGTTAVTWSQFSSAGTYTAGTGLTLTGTVFSLTSPVAVSLGGTGTTTAFTPGSVVFAGTSGVYSQDNANLFWDDSNNRLGIGTATPGASLNVVANTAGDAVRITQTGAGNALVVEDSANPDATPFVVDASGKLIIGTTASQTISASGGMSFLIESAGGANQSTSGIVRNSADVGSGVFRFGKSRGTTAGSFTSVSSGDGLGTIDFFGADGTAYIGGASISAAVDGTPGTNDMPGRLVFSTTADGASSPTERMRITNDGRITAGAGVGAGSTATQFTMGGNLVSASNVTRAFSNIGTAPTTSTTEVSSFVSAPSTADGIAAVAAINGFVATQGTITGGTRTTPTGQYGFAASSALIGATNNYGFYGNIPSGTGRWNFYANGTAPNYFAGDVGIGTTLPMSVAGYGWLTINGSTGASLSLEIADVEGFRIQHTSLSTNINNIAAVPMLFSTNSAERMRIDSIGQVGIGTVSANGYRLLVGQAFPANAQARNIASHGIVTASNTTAPRYYNSLLSTASNSGTPYTVANVYHYIAEQGTIDVDSTITTQHGFHAASSITGATNNIGFFSNLAASTGRWNFYANGSAPNYFAGSVGINSTAPEYSLHIRGSTASAGGVFVQSNNASAASPVVRVQALRSDGNASQSFTGGLVLEKIRSDGAIQDTNRLGTIYFGGNYDTTPNLTYPASISAVADGNWSSTTTASTGIAFYTGSTGQALNTANVTFGSERMRISSGGNVSIGTSTAGSTSLRVSRTADQAFYVDINANSAANATTTTGKTYFYSVASTSANGGVPYTVAALAHYQATGVAFHADSTVTNQYGFLVSNPVVGATNNYAFYANIPDGTGRWNFFAQNTAPNYFGGAILTGSTITRNTVSTTGTTIAPILEVHGTTFASASAGISNWANSAIQLPTLVFSKSKSGTVGTHAIVASGDDLGAVSFTGSDGTGFINAASISAQVDGTPGTNDMPGRLVFSTTADGASTLTERMRIDNGGRVAIGATTAAAQSFRVTKNITGDTLAYGIVSNGAVQTDVTNTAYYNFSISSTAASASIAGIQHYSANQGTFGAGSTVTSQYGFITNSTLIGATNNYGFYSDIASGTGRWNFFANGTAANAFAGSSRFGGVTAPVNTVDITGSLGRGAPVTKTANFTLAATENWIICNGTGSITVTLPAASSWTGRELTIKTIAAQTVVSASSNVVPRNGNTAGTAILAAAAGNWATLVSDGTNWVIMAGS